MIKIHINKRGDLKPKSLVKKYCHTNSINCFIFDIIQGAQLRVARGYISQTTVCKLSEVTFN